MKELELQESRAPCEQSASTTDKIVKRITDLPPFDNENGDESRESFIENIKPSLIEGNYEGLNPGCETLVDVWSRACRPVP